MVILKYKESLNISQTDSFWVYEFCPCMPEWDSNLEDYNTPRGSRRITPQEAKELIRENELMCVENNEFGKIWI